MGWMIGPAQVIEFAGFWPLECDFLANYFLGFPRIASRDSSRSSGWSRAISMRPRERRETSEQDLFRSRLDQIIDMNHALVKLARTIDWGFLEQTFGAVYTDNPGQPPLPTRLMAGLAILKHTYDLSDEALCDRWVENPYFQYFCGEEFFQHALVFDRSSLTRWRQRLGEEQIAALLQESLSVAHRTGAIDKLVELAKREGIELRQSYLRLAKRATIMVGRYTHAHQFKRARRELKFLRTR